MNNRIIAIVSMTALALGCGGTEELDEPTSPEEPVEFAEKQYEQELSAHVECVAPLCDVYMTSDLGSLAPLGQVYSGTKMGVLGRKDQLAIVSYPMPDRGNEIQVVKLDTDQWSGRLLPDSDDRVRCDRASCTVNMSADLKTLAPLGTVEQGSQMGILGGKGTLVVVSLPMADRQNKVQVVSLDDGWSLVAIASYPTVGFDFDDLAHLREAFEHVPAALLSLPSVATIRYDASAGNANYVRATKELVIDPGTRRDGSWRYVLTHELAHAWSAVHGKEKVIGTEAPVFVGPAYAGGVFFERCYPCDAGTSKITDCYAAGNALSALGNPLPIGNESWVRKMVGFDEDFAETVATYYGARSSQWVNDDLKACTPTKRNQWIKTNIGP